VIVSYFILAILIAVLVGALWLYFSTSKTPLLSGENTWRTKEEIGNIEEQLWRCKEVILVADKIQVPTRDDAKEILIALIDNFIDGVQYNFLVPDEYYKKYEDKITNRYRRIIKLAADFSQKEIVTELFKIHPYPHAKLEPDYPYLFYRYETDEGDEIIAFRGEDLGEGIAEQYRRIEPEVARSFLLRALPYIHGEELTASSAARYERFSSSDVIPIDRNRKRIKESAL
jgi:hypothetical protein